MCRLAGAVSVLVLSPMVAHTIWRPAAVALGSPVDGIALRVSLAAVAVAVVAVATLRALLSRREQAWIVVLLTSLAAGGLAGGLAGAVSLAGVGAFALAVLPRVAASLSAVQGAASLAGVVAWCVVGLGCVAGSVNLATYFGDPWTTGVGVDGDGALYRHFCASAYLHAAELVQQGVGNAYDLSLVPSEGLPESAAHMAPFELDRYGYPPPFLLLPIALSAVVEDFTAQRAVWTCLNALLFAAALWRVGLWVGPRSGRIVRWAAPVLWVMAGPVYQSGNVQMSILALGVLAMIAFDERRDRLGGALLAGATVSKIAPGLLGVLLLAQGRWRAVAWTCVSAALLSVLALGVVGTEVFVAFAEYHLPRIASGEAFDFLDDDNRNVFENLSPFGIPFKLSALGLVEGDPWVWGPRVATVYAVGAFGLAILAGRRRLDRRGHAAVWMLVLTVGALRSPMGPGYLLAGVFWALSLAAAELKTPAGWGLGLLLSGLLALTLPFFWLNLWIALAGQALMHSVIVWLVVRPWPVLDPEHPPHALGDG